MNEIKPKLELQPLPARLRNEKGLVIISGPCSAETEEQVLQTAHGLKQIPEVTIFRAGVWKPRTRPNSFEGVGVQGLKWLQRVKKETGLATAIEVANARHVYEALKFGVDVLWVGARTSANPFSVQEIADALKGAEVPVFVKNPVNPDVELWIGALERLNNAGITQLGAILRGFTSQQKNGYRNDPKWPIAFELKRLVPEIPLICDPSHIAGKTEYLGHLSQKALDLNMEGLMIETHPDPLNALSDAKQQIRPAQLAELLAKLKPRNSNSVPATPGDPLQQLRDENNAVDYEILEALARRLEIIKQIGEYKKSKNMTIFQPNRWRQVVEDRVEKGESLGLDENFVKDIYQLIHNYSVKTQTEIINEDSKG